jgi:hypothetical protein
MTRGWDSVHYEANDDINTSESRENTYVGTLLVLSAAKEYLLLSLSLPEGWR